MHTEWSDTPGQSPPPPTVSELRLDKNDEASVYEYAGLTKGSLNSTKMYTGFWLSTNSLSMMLLITAFLTESKSSDMLPVVSITTATDVVPKKAASLDSMKKDVEK
jgi:hypothetical protein